MIYVNLINQHSLVLTASEMNIIYQTDLLEGIIYKKGTFSSIILTDMLGKVGFHTGLSNLLGFCSSEKIRLTCFQGVEKECIGNKWVNLTLTYVNG